MSPSSIMYDDPVTFEVVRGGLYAICEEMKSVMMRASFSPLLSLSADLSCAILDHNGDVVAQGNDIPVHLGAMPLERAEGGGRWAAGGVQEGRTRDRGRLPQPGRDEHLPRRTGEGEETQ